MEPSIDRQQENEHNDPLSRHFPIEIISQIFGFYPQISGYTSAIYASDAKGSPVSPFRITSVCKRWREIGFSTPSLWSSLVISIPSNGHAPLRLLGFDLVPPWLIRSGNLPLKILIYFRGSSLTYGTLGNEGLNLNPIPGLFRLIKRYASRWNALNLTMGKMFCELFLNQCELDTPILDYLHLHVPRLKYLPRPSPSFSLKCPLLSTLSTSNVDLHNAELDLVNVTHIRAAGLNTGGIAGLLKLAPRLENAQFIGIFLTPLDDSDFPNTHMHGSIKHIEYGLSRYGRTGPRYHFLDSLACPQLQRITLNFPYANEQLLDQKLLAFVSRSACNITHLTFKKIQRTIISHEALIYVLESLPTITNLRLTSAHGESTSIACTIFQRLSSFSSTASPASFLPNLKKLILEEWPVSMDIFLRLSEFLNVLQASKTSNHNTAGGIAVSDSRNSNKGTAESPLFFHPTRPIRTVQLILTTDDTTPRHLLLVPFKPHSHLRRLQNVFASGTRTQLTVIERSCKNGLVHEVDLLESSRVFYGAKK